MSKTKALLSIISKGRKHRVAAGPMTKIFFRKINGKTEVFSKFSKVDVEGGTVNTFFQNKGRTIADMKVDIRDAETATTIDTSVNKDFRRHGLSRELFKETAKKLSQIGKKYFRSGELRSAAQAKIRSKYNTKFIQQYVGRYGDETKFNIPKSRAIDAVKNGGVVQATTRLPLERVKLRGPDGRKGKVIYRRIGGKIIPIRINK